MAGPTTRQAEALAAVTAHWAAHGRSPTIRDLCVALAISSPNGVVCHLKALSKKGLIEWESNGWVPGRGVGAGHRPRHLARRLAGDDPGGGEEFGGAAWLSR